MRNILVPLLGAAALGAAATAATAADLPRRAEPPPIFTPVPVFTWTGFYIGGNGGYAFNGERSGSFNFPAGSIVNSPGTNGTLTFNDRNSDGVTGGGQIGYNYQLGSFAGFSGVVVGVEADAQYLGLRRGGGAFGPGDYTFSPTGGLIPNLGVAFVPQSGLIPGLDNPTINRTQRRSSYFGTVRGRLGFAFDRFLVFGTGGFAYGEHDDGYAYGGGIEYAFTNNVTVRAEYLRVNMDQGRGTATATFNETANTVTFAQNGGRNSFDVVRGAVNFKFNLF